MASRGTVTYGVAKVLTKILKPLVGKSPCHIHSPQDFVEQAIKVTLQPEKCLSSHDVTTLFSSSRASPGYNQESIGTRQHPKGKDSINGEGHDPLVRILAS